MKDKHYVIVWANMVTHNVFTRSEYTKDAAIKHVEMVLRDRNIPAKDAHMLAATAVNLPEARITYREISICISLLESASPVSEGTLF